MFRKLLALSFLIVASHAVAVLTLGTSPAGSLLGNLLQITSCGLAVAAMFAALATGCGLESTILAVSGMRAGRVGGVANLGWMYYEIVLRTEPPTGSVVGASCSARNPSSSHSPYF